MAKQDKRGRRQFVKTTLATAGAATAALSCKTLQPSAAGPKPRYESKDIGFDIHQRMADDWYFVSQMVYDPVEAFHRVDVCAAPALMAVVVKAAENVRATAAQRLAQALPDRAEAMKSDPHLVAQLLYNPAAAGDVPNLDAAKKLGADAIMRAQAIFSEAIRADVDANNGACNGCNGGCS